MPKVRRPRRGSLQFVPKKRARRLYPNIRTWPATDDIKTLGFSGYKAGMSHAVIVDTKKGSPTQGEEISASVTIIDCPPLKVIGVRLYELTTFGVKTLGEIWNEGEKKDKDLLRKTKPGKGITLSDAEKILEKIKKVRLLVRTQPRQSGFGKKKPEIFEISVGGKDSKEKIDYAKNMLGKEIKISDIFKEGEYIDVIGITKGKGTQGVVKRWGVSIQNRKAKKKRRHIGTLGPETPRKVIWTVPQAGQLGLFRRTELNKRIIKIGDNGDDVTPKGGLTGYGVVRGNYVIIEGSVPGPKKRLVLLRHAIRPPKAPFVPTEIRHLKK